MKLSTLIKAWKILYVKDTGEIRFCDLDEALQEAGEDIQNDMSSRSHPSERARDSSGVADRLKGGGDV